MFSQDDSIIHNLGILYTQLLPVLSDFMRDKMNVFLCLQLLMDLKLTSIYADASLCSHLL